MFVGLHQTLEHQLRVLGQKVHNKSVHRFVAPKIQRGKCKSDHRWNFIEYERRTIEVETHAFFCRATDPKCVALNLRREIKCSCAFIVFNE